MIKSKIKILILISGSIGAVKIPLLVSKLIKENYEVKCVLTQNAEKLIKPLSLSILSRNSCVLDQDQWMDHKTRPLHISLIEWADILLVAPLTATTLSKWACGNAEGLVASILIANTKPIIIAPAMNTNMWTNQSVQKNYELIKTHKNVLPLDPLEGLLACDQYGIGKIPENDLIILAINFVVIQKDNLIFDDLKRKTFLITGGATSEKIDPARKISNNSSGTMGLLLAQVARFRGAKVIYIHGPLQMNLEIKDGIKRIQIETGKDLNEAIKKEIYGCDFFIMNAAVTDLRFKNIDSRKIPKLDLSSYFSNNLELVSDILQDISKLKRSNQIFMGFCAFTGSLENLRKIIQKKFDIKGCDLIFANPIDIDGQGFGYSSKNEGWLFDNKGMEDFIEKTSKIDLANKLIDKIISINN